MKNCEIPRFIKKVSLLDWKKYNETTQILRLTCLSNGSYAIMTIKEKMINQKNKENGISAKELMKMVRIQQ